eukprot:PITA_33802
MNPTRRDVVKEELQKLLDVDFIYPIFDSEWFSPLVLAPNTYGRWNICIYYRELNKATLKDYFPLPFIDLGVVSPQKLEEQGVKIPEELSAQGTKTHGTKNVEGIKTLNDKKTLSIETLSDVVMQTFDNLCLDDDGTYFQSIVEKTFTPEYLSSTPSTLYLNSQILDLEKQFHDL